MTIVLELPKICQITIIYPPKGRKNSDYVEPAERQQTDQPENIEGQPEGACTPL